MQRAQSASEDRVAPVPRIKSSKRSTPATAQIYPLQPVLRCIMIGAKQGRSHNYSTGGAWADLCFLPSPVLPYDPGEQGDPLQAVSPARRQWVRAASEPQ